MTDEAGSRDMEQYVRSRWKALGNLWWDREYDENWISASDEKGQPIRLFRGRSTEAEAWQAAYAFTLEREKQIAEVKEEIAFAQIHLRVQHEGCGDDGCGCEEPIKRTIARLESTLAELTKGMKPLAGEAR